jgi:hypothetical protein
MGVGAPRASSKIRRASLAETKAADVSVSGDDSAAGPAAVNMQWFLLCRDENELYEWVSAVSAHIHVVHMRSIAYPVCMAQHMATGTSGTWFYEAPASTDPSQHRLPVGLRTIPERGGPRTGDAVYPGEIFEVSRLCLLCYALCYAVLCYAMLCYTIL